MNKIENTPLEKEEQGTLREPCRLKDIRKRVAMDKKYMQALRLKQDVQGTIMINYDNTPVGKRKVKNKKLAKRRHLDGTPAKRGMIATTLRLKQGREGIRMI